MYFGDGWKTADGKTLWEIFIPLMTTDILLRKLTKSIHDQRTLWSHRKEWKHKGAGRCTWGSVIFRNTDKTLEKFREDPNLSEEDFCRECRGKGHSWKCQIWNGQPYLVPRGEKPKGEHWGNPDWCHVCNGTGLR